MSLARLLSAFRKAPLAGAFFVGTLLWLPTAAAGECLAPRVDARATVARVTDGDTLALGDGRNVRIIGLDTPEMNYRSGRPEPLAVAAREALRQLVGRDGRVELQYGEERRDRYGRWLAHVFLPGGESVAARLLEQGLATALVIPPNLWNLSCYQAAERRARSAGRGLWDRSAMRPVAAAKLGRRAPGYGQVRGRVTGVAKNRGGIWLTVDGALTVHLPAESLRLFEGCRWDSLEGHDLLVRGRLRRAKSQWRTTVRHPVQLEWTGRAVGGCPFGRAPPVGS